MGGHPFDGIGLYRLVAAMAVDEGEAAEAVRDICGVTSRRDFEKPGNATERLRWYELDNAFQAWKAAENA